MGILIALVGACGASPPETTNLDFHVLSDADSRAQVLPLLPEGAVLVRQASQGDVGLGPDSIVVFYANKGAPDILGGVIHAGKLIPMPPLYEDAPPSRISGVLWVQADTDPAGEMVVLVDRSASTPRQTLNAPPPTFAGVVVDYTPQGFVRLPAQEAAIAGLIEPNAIRLALQEAAAPVVQAN